MIRLTDRMRGDPVRGCVDGHHRRHGGRVSSCRVAGIVFHSLLVVSVLAYGRASKP